MDEAKVPAELGPGTIDGRLLALARDGKTIDEIGLALHATDFHLYQRLYALARQGILRAAAAAAAAAAAETVAAADLIDRARGLLAEGRAGDAELVAAKAVELAPGSDAARSILGEVERVLGARLRASAPRPAAHAAAARRRRGELAAAARSPRRTSTCSRAATGTAT